MSKHEIQTRRPRSKASVPGARDITGDVVEPVFSIKENHGYRRFRRRGLKAATSEWALITTSHNLGKLFRAHLDNPLGAT